MEIESKYFDLLWTYIYDKRCKASGMISSIEISRGLYGYIFNYIAIMNKYHDKHRIYINDFENGNVIFLMPFGIRYKEKEMDGLRKEQIKNIKKFFGDKFRENMVWEISEKERLAETARWDDFLIGLENWEHILPYRTEDNKSNNEN